MHLFLLEQQNNIDIETPLDAKQKISLYQGHLTNMIYQIYHTIRKFLRKYNRTKNHVLKIKQNGSIT